MNRRLVSERQQQQQTTRARELKHTAANKPAKITRYHLLLLLLLPLLISPSSTKALRRSIFTITIFLFFFILVLHPPHLTSAQLRVLRWHCQRQQIAAAVAQLPPLYKSYLHRKLDCAHSSARLRRLSPAYITERKKERPICGVKSTARTDCLTHY